MANQRRERRDRGRGREGGTKQTETRNQLQLWTVISAGHLFTKGQLWLDMLICAWPGQDGGRRREGRDTRQSRIPQYLLRERDLAHLLWTWPRKDRTQDEDQDQVEAHPETTQGMLRTALPKSMQNVLLTLHKQALEGVRKEGKRGSSLPSVTVEHAKG